MMLFSIFEKEKAQQVEEGSNLVYMMNVRRREEVKRVVSYKSHRWKPYIMSMRFKP